MYENEPTAMPTGGTPSTRRPVSSAKTAVSADPNQQRPAANQPVGSREKSRASITTTISTTTTGNLRNTPRRGSNDSKTTATSSAAVVAAEAPAMVGTAENVRVVVRFRPLDATEKQNGNQSVVSVDKLNNVISVANPAAAATAAQNSKQQHQLEPPKQFVFDTVFDIGSTQLDVYNEAARPVVESCLQGFNGTILAYGQTGTGKTFTMEGNRDVPELRGIIPNSFAHIFAHIAEAPENRQYLVRVSYFEIYQEELRDLLSKNHDQRLEVKENPQRGVYVKDLSEKVVHSPQELDKWMTIGNKNRSVGATQMNQHSSRSHAIFTITIERSDQDAAGAQHVRAGKMHLVDLAGSERQSKTGATGQRFKEATKINLALSALGNVISALVDGKSQHIPYRNAKLTRILQDSLGGNSKTLMIANCGPADYNYDETINTLRYASRAKNIKNVARINEDPKDALLRKIYEQIAELKRQMEDDASDGGGEDEDENLDDNEADSAENVSNSGKRRKVRRTASNKSSSTAAVGSRSNMLVQRRGSRIEKMMEIKAQILADRETLLKDKTMADEERQEMTHKLAEKEKSLTSMQEERNRLAEKLSILQNSIIVGGENLLEKAEEQQQLLEESQRELELRRAEEEKLRKTLEDKARQRYAIEQKHATLQDLLERKRDDMQSLVDRVQSLKGDLEDAENDLQREREDSEEHLKRLKMDVARADLIIRSYIPEHYVQLIMRNCYWNDAINEYQLNCYAYTGNQMKQQEQQHHYPGANYDSRQAKRKTREQQKKLERRMLNDQSNVFYTYATCDKAPVAQPSSQQVVEIRTEAKSLTAASQRVIQQQPELNKRPQTSMSSRQRSSTSAAR